MSDGTEETKGDLLAAESDDEIASNAIVVPLLNEAPITTVSCPIGTTAQPDMTCLITGDYQPVINQTCALKRVFRELFL